MSAVTDFLVSIFGDSPQGILLCIAIIFFVDALIFPMLPELFFIFCFMYDPTPVFGTELLLAATIGEIMGVLILYTVVEHIHVPRKIKAVVSKYVNFMIIGDERMLLVNRVAPMVPFTGAFISIAPTWKLSTSLIYLVLGCLLKYGLIMVMSSWFFAFFSSEAATFVSIGMVVALMAISFAVGYYKKKSKETEGKEVETNEDN
jgi:membrane protein YqaA with SNARE-associated domain